MALSFRPRDAEEWRTGMNDIPVFAVRTAEAFNEQLLASKPDPATGKPDLPRATESLLGSTGRGRHARSHFPGGGAGAVDFS
jgi:hypothetical protein